MREVKFRGKTTNGEWVFGSLVVTSCGLRIKPKQHTKTWIIASAFGNGGWFNIMQRYYVRPETVGQFAGLKDKNGVEIYEGDIVCGTFGIPPVFVKSAVEYKNGVFLIKTPKHNTQECSVFDAINYLNIEVIGNIHDNPELLAKK